MFIYAYTHLNQQVNNMLFAAYIALNQVKDGILADILKEYSSMSAPYAKCSSLLILLGRHLYFPCISEEEKKTCLANLQSDM